MQYCVSVIFERPWFNFILVSVIIFKYLDTQRAISAFEGHKIVRSLCSRLICPKLGKREVNLPKKQFLFRKKVLHFNIAWYSSSISLLEQYLQILEVTGVTGLVYRPDSIPNVGTALTRYLVSQALWDLLSISVMYGSCVKELFNFL